MASGQLKRPDLLEDEKLTLFLEDSTPKAKCCRYSACLCRLIAADCCAGYRVDSCLSFVFMMMIGSDLQHRHLVLSLLSLLIGCLEAAEVLMVVAYSRCHVVTVSLERLVCHLIEESRSGMPHFVRGSMTKHLFES